MSRYRFSLADPPPSDAEVYKRLKFQRIEGGNNGACYCKAWRGRAQKPYAHYSFRSPEARERWIAEQKDYEDGSERLAAETKAREAERTAEMCERLKVGTILHYDWGYEQTNCEFYQVVARTAKTATIRRIGSKTVRATGPMAETVKPVPGHYIGKPKRKRINGAGVSMAFGVATPTDPDKAYYSSWYA